MSRYPLIPDLEGRAVTVADYIDLQVPLLVELVGADGGARHAERLEHGLGLTESHERNLRRPAASWRPTMATPIWPPPESASATRWTRTSKPPPTPCSGVTWTPCASLLEDHPSLVRAPSRSCTTPTLRHLVAANGVEVERQLQSPANAVEVARLLLTRGAEPDATCDTYGDGPAQTALYLLVSSCVSAEAGVKAALVEALCAAGASVDGVEDDCKPLWTAVAFGYPQAAEVEKLEN